MSKLKVSVAITTCNGERFVAEQLESFARQERLPDELVVSDDASTDSTIDIVREFAARVPFPVRIFVNETRLGINANFGRAIEECTGDIIFLSDSDDYWYPKKIRLMERAFEETPEAGIAVCNAEQTDEHLRPLGVTTWNQADRYLQKPRRRRELALGTLYWAGMPAQGCCLAFRAKCKDLLLPLPDSNKFICFSYDRVIAQIVICSGAGGALFLTEPLQSYRRHGGQATQPFSPLFTRIKWSLNARHDVPYQLPFFLQRIESDLAARLCINPAMRQAVMRHWSARVNMPATFAGRLPVVAREFLSLRYHRFSGDTFSAAKDLFFSRQPIDESNHPAGAHHGPGTPVKEEGHAVDTESQHCHSHV